jgi:large subunit ribosomal protein L10
MRPEKKSILEEIKNDIAGSEYVVLTNCRGLNVQKLAELRVKLRKSGSRLKVAKNTFIHHAAKQAGRNGLDEFLIGPTALIYGKSDVCAVAKLLKDFIGDSKMPTIKGGLMGPRVLSKKDIEDIADLPPKKVLQGILVGTIAAPMSQLVGVMNSKLLTLLYALKAIETKKGGQSA